MYFLFTILSDFFYTIKSVLIVTQGNGKYILSHCIYTVIQSMHVVEEISRGYTEIIKLIFDCF